MTKHDSATRPQQALKIYNLLLESYKSENGIHTKDCLDIGCGTGEIGKILASRFQSVVGIEVDLHRIQIDENGDNFQKNFYFTQADGAHLPFENDSFDFIICAQVYEHTEDQYGLVSEIQRVLKEDGVCFFSGPNKFTIMEEHYFLPFLSWLPTRISDFYVRFFHRNSSYDIHPLSYHALQKLLRNFAIEDKTLQILQNPERYGMVNRFAILGLIQYMPLFLVKPILFLIPNFNFILRKNVHLSQKRN
ncbi:methylase [Longilinea arvoryzae]|uniref:Methylase n=1 Tax=Longilinea arvoryzae TaxID=360412 RepID=A0A0S7BJ03_9CHLR|nr:class I SAM-dependent methyltransferase [Longilinea arvoryzae]GAP13765.1 methylase [Longilinea arvoryzae]